MEAQAIHLATTAPRTEQSPNVSAERSAPASVSKAQRWAGRVMSGIAALFLLFDGGFKLMKGPLAIQGTLDLGYPESSIVPMGVLVLTGTVLYLFPRTAVLGAIFLTGFLGGAVATHVRVSNPLFSHVLFPTYVAALLWGGLALRNARVREILWTRE